MPHFKFIFPFLFLPLLTQAQVEIFLPGSSSSFVPEDVFVFRLQNHHTAPQRVYFTARLKTNREILFLQSASVLLAPGGRTFLPGEIPVVQVEGVESLPAGVYTFCLSVIQEDNGQEWGTQCVSRRYETTTISQPGSENGKNQPVTFSGQARLTARISNQPDLFTGIPPRYIRLQASPRMSVLGIPLEGRVFLSTEQERFRYDLNTIGLHLDTRQLLTTMRQQALAKIQAATGGNLPQDILLNNKVQAMRESAYQKALHSLGPYQDILQDSALLSQFKELEQLDRIRQVLVSPEFEEIRLHCESLDKKIEGWDIEKHSKYRDSCPDSGAGLVRSDCGYTRCQHPVFRTDDRDSTRLLLDGSTLTHHRPTAV